MCCRLLTALLIGFVVTFMGGCEDSAVESPMPKNQILKNRKMPLPRGGKKLACLPGLEPLGTACNGRGSGGLQG